MLLGIVERTREIGTRADTTGAEDLATDPIVALPPQ